MPHTAALSSLFGRRFTATFLPQKPVKFFLGFRVGEKILKQKQKKDRDQVGSTPSNFTLFISKVLWRFRVGEKKLKIQFARGAQKASSRGGRLGCRFDPVKFHPIHM